MTKPNCFASEEAHRCIKIKCPNFVDCKLKVSPT